MSAGNDGDAADSGFLSRWSRRKRATVAPPAPELSTEAPPAPEVPPAGPPADPAPAPGAAAEPPALSDDELAALPRVEDLTEGSDIRAFLRPGVPAALRSAALRRMWMLTPAIRDHRDPAVDYAWDWNTPGGVPGDGAAPSPERASAMLRDLLEPRDPAPPPASDRPADPEPIQSDPAGQGGGQAPRMPDAAPGRALAEPAQVPEKGPQTGPTGTPVAARRRHGGALPGEIPAAPAKSPGRADSVDRRGLSR